MCDPGYPAEGRDLQLATVNLVGIFGPLPALDGERGRKVPTRELPDWIVRVVGRFDAGARLLVTELGAPKQASSADARELLGWTPRSRGERRDAPRPA